MTDPLANVPPSVAVIAGIITWALSQSVVKAAWRAHLRRTGEGDKWRRDDQRTSQQILLDELATIRKERIEERARLDAAEAESDRRLAEARKEKHDIATSVQVEMNKMRLAHLECERKLASVETEVQVLRAEVADLRLRVVSRRAPKGPAAGGGDT